MAGFFRSIGRFLGESSRKASWLYRSFTADEEEAWKAEQAVGRDMARAVLEQSQADTDPAVAAWIEEIGGLVAGKVGPHGNQFIFRALLVPEPNAFALPGGFVFVTRALLKLCNSSHDELAFVLGHEVAHIVCGHASENVVSSSLMKSTARVLRLPAAGLVTKLLGQSYSRDQELEADREGVKLAHAAGFNPQSALNLLEVLQGRFSGTTGEALGYFSSHPTWNTRLENLRRTVPRLGRGANKSS